MADTKTTIARTSYDLEVKTRGRKNWTVEITLEPVETKKDGDAIFSNFAKNS